MQQGKYYMIIKATAVLSILVGFLTITGWIFDIPVLRSVISGFPNMKFNTAVCFILAGISLIMLLSEKFSSRSVSKLLSLLVLLIGLISFTENLFHYDAGLDDLFFYNTASSAPGTARMASATSFSFMLIGISFFSIRSPRSGVRSLIQYLLHFVSAIATIVIVGYLYRVPTFYKLFLLSSVALHTGIMLFLLSLAASFINSEKGITGLFTGREIGNQMARDIFPLLVILILVTGFLRLQFFRTHAEAIEFGIAIVTTSFMIFSLLIIGLTAKQLNRINRKMLQAEEQQEKLLKDEEIKKKEIMNAIINAQEKERYEISHELHDNVSQVLTTCKLLMETAAQENDNKFIRLSREHLQLAIDEIRNLSHQLDPATLTHIGLEGSINDLIGAVNKTQKINIKFKFDINNIEKVRPEIQLALFRIIQEQVNNILKHSEAKKASIDLNDEDEKIRLSIKDDGKGHDLTFQKHGLGLRNIFNRAEFHKGQATVFSEPDKGFELSILLPINS
jgi:signal transduction histidine kinase